MRIFGLGPVEFTLVLGVMLIPVLIVVNAVRKGGRTEHVAVAPADSLASRVWAYYSRPYRDYATFRGRATRREFWVFAIVNGAIGLGLSALDQALGLASSFDDLGVLYGIFAVATVLPSIAVSVRRLHDGNRTGWWLLVHLAPLVGWLVALYQFTAAGTPGPNRFGSNPRGDGIAAAPEPVSLPAEQ